MSNSCLQRPRCRIYPACFLAALIASLAVTGSPRAEERTQRRFDMISGFSSVSIFSLAQDRAGFLWVGIEGGGLARFDGRELRRWAPEIRSHVLFGRGEDDDLVLIVEPDPGGESGNTLKKIAGNGVAPIPGPEGRPWTMVKDAAYDRFHKLWVARPNALFFRNDNDTWVQFSASLLGLLDGSRIRRLSPDPAGGILVVTSRGILRIGPDGAVSRQAQTSLATDAIDRGDGSIFFVEKQPAGGQIFEVRGGQVSQRLFVAANFVWFVLRGETVWAAFDSAVVALRAGEKPELFRPSEGIPGGANLVDREGGLWIATAAGLVLIPEPEAALWSQRDGLPGNASRYLAETDEGIWIATWSGICRLERTGEKWKVVVDQYLEHKWPLATDAWGRLWGKHRDEFLERVGGRFRKYYIHNSGVILASARAFDGTLWIGTDRGLFQTPASEGPPVWRDGPVTEGPVDQAFEDSRGELWVASGNGIYHSPAKDVAAGIRSHWTPDKLDANNRFTKITETSSGTLWAATSSSGVWRRVDGKWSPIAASAQLSSLSIYNLVPSRSGGMWVLGNGLAFRVLDRPDLAAGWEIAEQLTVWQGVPATGLFDILEEADGTLWLATNAGVLRVRPEARRAHPEPPRVESTGLIVNGKVLDFTARPIIDYGANPVELHFAALSYRNPGMLRYQYRLRDGDPWTNSEGSEAVFRFFGLQPGPYSMEVRGSLDGAAWSPHPARIVFEVLRPWYFRWWTILAALLAISTIGFAVHRARVAVLLRLERQRTLIAMDLHDEIGSGLGSIGILADVVASENVEDLQRRDIARNIAETAAEMGSTLTDIVWSLRPESAALEGLAYRLVQRGTRLFPDGTTFKTNFPKTWPSANLSLAVRQNLLLIASEALYNAARHARAQQVVLGIARAGRFWELSVADDGCGVHPDTSQNDSSFGLATMQKRAKGIGAHFGWSSKSGVGTSVTVTFTLEGRSALKSFEY